MNMTRCPDPRLQPRTWRRPTSASDKVTSEARPDTHGVRVQGERNGGCVGTDGGLGRYGLPADCQCTGTTPAFARPATAPCSLEFILKPPKHRSYAAAAAAARHRSSTAFDLQRKCIQSCQACPYA